MEDVEQVRQDLHTLLTLTGDLRVVGEAGNGLEAIQLAKALLPDVVLMDLEMPVMDGYEATRQIKAFWPACQVIILSIHAGETEQQSAFQAGADGFIVKGAPLEALMEVIHRAPTFGQIPKGDRT